MPQAGDELWNPVTGERLVFRQVPEDEGEVLAFDHHWTTPGHRVAAHIHPSMSETWEVVTGVVTFRIGGRETSAGPGGVVTAEPGTTHMAWMVGDEPVHLRVTVAPALRWAQFTEEWFALAASGRVDEDGLPPEDALMSLFARYPREIAAPHDADTVIEA